MKVFPVLSFTLFLTTFFAAAADQPQFLKTRACQIPSESCEPSFLLLLGAASSSGESCDFSPSVAS
jgi:hypothetical protein